MVAENNTKTETKQEGKEFINSMVDSLRAQTHYISIQEWDKKSIYRYENGIFIRDGDTKIKELLRDFSRSIMPETMNTITKLLQAETYDSYKNLDKDINHIVTNNNVINIITGEAKELSPKYKSTFRIPVNYDPNAKCPKFDKFLSEIVYPEDIPVVEEMFGYCLYKTNVYKKIFYLFGTNDCGKSTLLDLLKCFLGGNEVVSAESIQDLGNPMKQYAVASLFGKLANICGEAPTTPVKETGLIKSLSYGDLIEGNEKFGNKTRFVNYAKLIFASNHMIIFPEVEEFEMMSRMKFILFPNSIPLEKQDKTLLSKLTSPEELSGILNLAIKGLQRMIKNGEMSNYKTKEENLEFYYSFGSSVRKFVNEKIERSAIGDITQPDLYVGYTEFCKKQKLPVLSNKKFFEEFKLVIGFNEDMKCYRKINGQSTKAINGIIWKFEDVADVATTFNATSKNNIVETNNVADVADVDILLYSKNKNITTTHINNVPTSAESTTPKEIEEIEPEFRTEAEIQQEKDAFENLEEQEKQAEKNLEEIAKEMFPQAYPEPENKESKPKKEYIKTPEQKYPCRSCGEKFYKIYLGFEPGKYNPETDGICGDCRHKETKKDDVKITSSLDL